MPEILVTNDDGIQSHALEALEIALGSIGHVTVVAPDREMSATSQCITINQPLRYQQLAPNRFAVHGTPSDCVILGSVRILKEKPSLVVSGVNRRGNLGRSVRSRPSRNSRNRNLHLRRRKSRLHACCEGGSPSSGQGIAGWFTARCDSQRQLSGSLERRFPPDPARPQSWKD